MRERPNRAVSKTAVGVTRPWVRIPPSPPNQARSTRSLVIDLGDGIEHLQCFFKFTTALRVYRRLTSRSLSSLLPADKYLQCPAHPVPTAVSAQFPDRSKTHRPNNRERVGFEQEGPRGKVPPRGEHTRGLGPLSKSVSASANATSNAHPLRHPCLPQLIF